MKENQKEEELEKNGSEQDNAQEKGTEEGPNAEAKENADEQNDTKESSEQDELSEMKDKYIRLYSEFDNFRRRTAKEKQELVSTANADLLSSLIPVLDDFQRARSLKNEEQSDDDGFELIYQKFAKTLESNGLKTMECGPGSEFDTELHEAISQIPAPDEKLKGKIVDVVEKGYFLKEKVIRFAKVVVGS